MADRLSEVANCSLPISALTIYSICKQLTMVLANLPVRAFSHQLKRRLASALFKALLTSSASQRQNIILHVLSYFTSDCHQQGQCGQGEFGENIFIFLNGQYIYLRPLPLSTTIFLHVTATSHRNNFSTRDGLRQRLFPLMLILLLECLLSSANLAR